MAWPAEHQDRFSDAYAGAPVCVTGGAGFIGSRLVESLLALGAQIKVLDDLSSSSSERLMDLLERSTPGAARFIHASILEPRALADAVDGASIVFHLAAVASAAQATDEPVRCVEVNGLGTARVAEAARRAGVERIVYTASASAYGDGPAPNVESQPPRPLSPYAASKLSGEHIVRAWASSRGVDGVSLRFFNVYGPGQSPDSDYAAVVPAFAKRLKAGKPPIIYGDGAQTRDLVHLDDAVTALLLAGSCEQSLNGDAINIGSGSSVSVAGLASLMAKLCGVEGMRPIHEPARAGDVRESACDLSQARRRLGFAPTVELETGLRRLLDGCKGRSAAAV